MQFLYYFVVLIASYFVARAMAPKVEKPKPVALEDIEFPQFEEGTPQEVLFGDCWTDSWMVLGVGNYRVTEIRSKAGK